MTAVEFDSTLQRLTMTDLDPASMNARLKPTIPSPAISFSQGCFAGRQDNDIGVELEFKYLAHLEEAVLGVAVSWLAQNQRRFKDVRNVAAQKTVGGKMDKPVTAKIRFQKFALGGVHIELDVRVIGLVPEECADFQDLVAGLGQPGQRETAADQGTAQIERGRWIGGGYDDVVGLAPAVTYIGILIDRIAERKQGLG